MVLLFDNLACKSDGESNPVLSGEPDMGGESQPA